MAPPNNNLMAADRWLQVAHSNLRVKEFTSNNSIVFMHYYCGNRRPPGTRWQAFSAFIRFFGKNNGPCRKPDLRNSESNMGYSSATASIDCGRQDGGSTSCMDMTATTVGCILHYRYIGRYLHVMTLSRSVAFHVYLSIFKNVTAACSTTSLMLIGQLQKLL